MKVFIVSILCTFGIVSLLQAQCPSCPEIGKKADFCFDHKSFPSKCAQFVDKDSDVYFFPKQGAKVQKLTIPAKTDAAGMLAVVKQTKNKISAEDIVFLHEAFNAWYTAQKNLGYTVTTSGLGYKIAQLGQGKKPEAGKKVSVHYKGYLENGTVFDSSFERNQPIDFTLGAGQVIKGWDEGIQLFPVGSKGTLRIPAELGYGKRGAGNMIPPDATLFFDIEVIHAD